jgi:hypothetical protein
MRKVIYKYPLPMQHHVVLEVKGFVRILSIQEQQHQICLWCEIDPESETTRILNFKIIGTGHEFHFKTLHEYVGTVQIRGYVWHIYRDLP